MKTSPAIIEHWHTQYDNLQLSTNEFYTAIETVLKEKKLPEVTMERHNFIESSWLGNRREYLIIERFEFQFIICAAPFGQTFFFSWYVKEYITNEWLKYIPFIGTWLLSFSLTKTFFQNDTMIMFKESVKEIVKSVIAEVEKDKGVRALGIRTVEVI